MNRLYHCFMLYLFIYIILLILNMANGQCSIKSECGKTSDEPYILNSSTFSSKEKNNFGEFRFDTNRSSDSFMRCLIRVRI
jgi:hypothetical protein